MTVELVDGGVRVSYAAGHVVLRSPAAVVDGLGLEEWAELARLPELGPAPRYGPHRPEDAPATVAILGPERWPCERSAPMPAALLAQREAINTRAATRRAISGG